MTYQSRSADSRPEARQALALCIGGASVRRLEYAKPPETVAAIQLAKAKVEAALNLSDEARETLEREIHYRAEHVSLDPDLHYHFRSEQLARFGEMIKEDLERDESAPRRGEQALLEAISRLRLDLPARIIAVLQEQARSFIARFGNGPTPIPA